MEVFQHGWHDGIKDTYTQSTPQVRRNDDLSSLKVSSGCCAILYEDAKYKGASKKVCKDMQIDEFGHDWNDKVSSIKIEKQGKMANISVVFLSSQISYKKSLEAEEHGPV